MSIKKFNKTTGKWEIQGTGIASEIALLDMEGNFQSGNVEGALNESARKIKEQETKNNANTSLLQTHASVLKTHQEDIEWLKEHGGGGSGGSAPTITSTLEDNKIIQKGEELIIPIFFSSPNMGDGLAYVMIDGIEVKTEPIKQGNNRINVGTLPNLRNEVSIYAKDRTNALSNQLTWTIMCGGIDVTVDFDSDADYTVTDDIRMQFNVQSASDEPIIMHLTVGYNKYEVPCRQGINEYVFKDLGVGVHKVSFYMTSGIYKSSVFTFNIVVVNANSLYVSSTFEGGEHEYGNPISINYRISKVGTEEFTVNLILNEEVVKSLRAKAGSYYWTLNDIEIGNHKVKIEVISDYGETVFVEREFTVIQGEYTPQKIVESGLIYRLSAEGKTNNDADKSNPIDASGNGVKTTLHNFNYFSNGWIDGALVCDGNAYVEIDCYPWSENAIFGSTIEIQYKGLDIGFDDARIFDYTDIETPYKGAYIDLNESTMKSLANTGKVNVDKDTWTTLTFVIDRKAKFGKIFIDGICSRAFSLSDTGSGTSAVREDFTHAQKIYLNSRKGLDKFGACEIKDVRVYNRVLTDDEILQNNIAQIKDMKQQKELFNKNYKNTSLPTIRMYGDMTNMTLETPVNMRIKYTSPNDEKYGQSFDLPYCSVNWQGTSSLQYVLKNFTVRLKDENMADYEYTPYPNGVPETVYCFKCDYMESTHSRNAGLAKFVNECLYDSKNPAQLKDEKVRNTINGFPTLLYINDELQGVYNFNLDRYSTKSYGYHDDGKCLVYEVSANSDTTAGAFHKWTQETGKDKLDYYKSDFECLFPPTRASGNDNMEELIRLIEWVNDASDEDFRDNIHNYFNKEYLLRYYLYVLVVGAVDSLGKNMKLATWDGRIWYPQVYDADTTIGLDNTGFLKFDMDIEMGDPHVFNTTGSKLWQKVRVLFEKELQEQYALMRQKHFTVDNFMKYLLGEQIEQIPARYYNIDMQTKYLNYGSSYLYALHGSGEQHIRKWLRERLIYVDTLLGYNVSTSDYITLRSSKLGEVYLDIETYIPMYVRVKWRDESGGTGIQVKRVARGEKVRFSYNMPTATDQEIIVYGGYYLKSIGDVSNLQLTTMLIANASRLTEIECHSPNLINTDLSECTKLQKIDLSDCTALGTGIGSQPILNIQRCKYLKYCNCSNTQLTAIYTMQEGGNLEELYFPESTQVVQVTNQTHLKRLGLPLDVENDIYCKNLATVQISNCKSIQTIHYPFNEDDGINFDAFKYVQSLTINNSLDDLKEMSFSGFSKLKNVTLESLNNLTKLGFDDMLPVDEISTLKTIAISNIPQVDAITFNVSSNDYKVEFAKNAKIDIGGLLSCRTLESNYSIKGLDTIILPITIKNVYLNTEYGDGENEIKNLWSSNAIHNNDGFTGIDFLDMELNDFAMNGCKNLKKAINFYLYPINSVPSLNLFEQMQGGLHLDAYIGDVKYLFRNLDFTNPDFTINLNKDMQQSDITGLFQNAIITSEIAERLLRHFPNATVWDSIFNSSTIEKDIDIPNNIISIIDGFKDCLNLKRIRSNWLDTYDKKIVSTNCYSGCDNIQYIDDIPSELKYVPKDWGGSGHHISEVTELQGNTSVNYRIGENETINITNEINESGDSITLEGDYNNIQSDVYLEGHTAQNLSNIKDPIMVIHKFDDIINDNNALLEGSIDGTLEVGSIVGKTLSNYSKVEGTRLVAHKFADIKGNSGTLAKSIDNVLCEVGSIEGNTLLVDSNNVTVPMGTKGAMFKSSYENEGNTVVINMKNNNGDIIDTKSYTLDEPLRKFDKIVPNGEQTVLERYTKVMYFDGDEMNLGIHANGTNDTYVSFHAGNRWAGSGGICDKLPFESWSNQKKECLWYTQGESGIIIKRSNLTSYDAKGLNEYLKNNPITVLTSSSSPISKTVLDDKPMYLKTSGNCSISTTSAIPVQKITFNSINEGVAVEPNTTYRVSFNADKDNECTINLANTKLDVVVNKGYNTHVLTTPSAISNATLAIIGQGFSVDKITLTKGEDDWGVLPTGTKSCFEDGLVTDELDENYGKYKAEIITSSNDLEDKKIYYLDEPLRQDDKIEYIDGNVKATHTWVQYVDNGSGWGNYNHNPSGGTITLRKAFKGIPSNSILICDVLPFISGAWNKDIEGIYFDSDYLYAVIGKAKGNVTWVGSQNWIKANPPTILYKKAEPIEKVLANEKIYLDTFENCSISANTVTPMEKITFNSTENHTMNSLKPNTTYRISFNADNDGLLYVFKLCGIDTNYFNVSEGFNTVVITTPDILQDDYLVLDGQGFNMSNIIITETDRLYPNYFEGTMSVGQGEDVHGIEIVCSNSNDSQENKLTIPLTEPLRSIGDVCDRIVKKDGNKWYIERNCEQRDLDISPLDIPTYEEISANNLTLYDGVTYINSNSIIPCRLTIKNKGFNARIKPNTQYTILPSGKDRYYLGGAYSYTNVITTPDTLTDSDLRIFGEGSVGDVMVLEGRPVTPEYHEGLLSSFEDCYNEDTSMYQYQFKLTNEDGTDESIEIVSLSQPLRAVGDTKDKVFRQENRLMVERKCGERKYNSLTDTSDNILTDLTKTVYVLESPIYEEVQSDSYIALSGTNKDVQVITRVKPTMTIETSWNTTLLSDEELEELQKENIHLLSTTFELDFRLFELEWLIEDATKTKLGDRGKTITLTQYEMAKKLILLGAYDRFSMKYKLDKYKNRGIITEEQYNELNEMM